MPTNDEPARTPRRPLGRGPGGRPAQGAEEPSATGGPGEADAPVVPPAAPLPVTGTTESSAVTYGDVRSAHGDGATAADGHGTASADAGGPAAATEPAEPAELAEPVEPVVSEKPAELELPDSAGSTDLAEPAGDGRFTVRLANFEGPFDLLLQLISKHRLDVTEVALSKVTDEFMAHIRAMGPDWDLDQTTEFLVVAATLLDLKAARLLPAAEVEDEADLALLEARDLLFARLLQYRAYKRIAEIFSARLESEGRRFPRTVGLEPHHAELLPEVVISIGAEGFARLAVKAMQPKPKPQVYVDHIHAPLVSVREQAEIVVARLREAGEISFRQLTEDAADTLTVVARFLALLELYREKAVTLDQEEALGELMVRWAGGADAAPRVTDEFDQDVQEDAEA
ncbi:segregation and condensation protein A [Streptomyces sp. NPDC056227]|uniref:segregation and condensation protein A n=1 Tax=Streptomyces sp. NPDC056227 TaxID=3345753 RepID=UPI0035D5601E